MPGKEQVKEFKLRLKPSIILGRLIEGSDLKDHEQDVTAALEVNKEKKERPRGSAKKDTRKSIGGTGNTFEKTWAPQQQPRSQGKLVIALCRKPFEPLVSAQVDDEDEHTLETLI